MHSTRRHLSSILIVFLAALFFAASASAQDWRGMGRMNGTVKDDSGQPIEGVVVKAHRVGSEGGPQTKTNKKGEWVIAGIANGSWDLDFDKPGYEPRRQSASILEGSRNPPIETTMKKGAADPNIAINADLSKAADLVKQQKYAEARAIYEDLLAKHPEAYQIEPYIARTYYAEHQLEPAIQHLRNALAKEPDNIDVKLLLATVLAEKGDADESRQLIASIDESKITDPATLLNIGIGLLNNKKPDEALTWFDKVVTRFPAYADGYYYRGLTELQQGKTDAAKTDLTKFVEMAPNAPEAATAKGILEKLK
jgi:tetratricopeptide (TPR) repeat protein